MDAARLIHERGVAGTTLDDVRPPPEVSGSQLSHYFAGKDELVQAVMCHQAGVIAGNQEHADLGRREPGTGCGRRRHPAPGNRWALLRSPGVVVLSAQYLLWSIGVYGFVFWLPTIVAGLTRQGIGTTGAVSAGPYAAAVLAMLAALRLSDGSSRRRGFVWLPLAAAAAAFYASYLVGNGSFTTSFILFIRRRRGHVRAVQAVLRLHSRTTASASAGPAIGLINAFGGLGGFAGTYLVGWLGGGTRAAFIFLASCLLASALLMFAVRQPAAVPQAPGRQAAARSRPSTA